jgi:hypothetical protein
MRSIKSLGRLGVVLASLAVVAVSLASSASASTTVIPVGGGSGAPDTGPVTVVRTVVVGGMPGWQIALIAVGSALVAVMAAVAAEHTWRRRGAVAPS